MKKEEAVPTVLLRADIHTRYDQCGAVDFPVAMVPSVHDRTVRRDFMSSKCGGSSQAMVSNISAAKRAAQNHAYEAFFFPMLKWNPYMPRTPGAPGLVFSVYSACKAVRGPHRSLRSPL